VKAVLADYKSAPIPERLRAAIAFLHKLTLTPTELSAADAEAARAAGLSDKALEEAIYVAFCFNTIDRIADAFDFEMTPPTGLKWIGRILSGPGYKLASVPG
jgi:alkylhydroperoxidase family enzyme